jgi:hypothetical protein
MPIIDRSTPEERRKRPPIVIEEVIDPEHIARVLAQHKRMKRNSDWQQPHWCDVLPQARGRFLAVAGQQAFIADTAAEARAMAAATHPDGNGVLVQYVRPERGPRIYAARYRGSP